MDEVEGAAHWEIRTLVDAYADRPPTEYIVDKFFSTHSLNVVYGAPGVMKSLLMADLCTSIVAGYDWLPGVNGGGVGVMVKESPILWLDVDNGTRRTDERFEALSRSKDLDENAQLYYLSMPNPPFYANEDDAVILLMQTIWQLGVKLVVVDNLGLVTGDVEENSAQMGLIMSGFRTVAERTGAAVILIHHQRKGGAGGSRLGDSLRGHSSIEAALDLALHIIREPNSPEVTMQSTKTRGVDVPTVTARFNYEHRPGTNDLRIAWFDGLQVIRGENPIRDEIIATLRDQREMTKGRLADSVYENLGGKFGVNKIRNWIDEMILVTKELEVKAGKGRTKIVCFVG
jgi:hypothetical protein